MPRLLKGHVEPRLLSDGSRAFYAKIRSDRALIGHEPEWTMERAERFLNTTLVPAAQLHQEWSELIPTRNVAASTVTVWQALDEYVERRRAKSTNENTRNAAESPVIKHLLPFFAFVDAAQQIERPLAEVDEALVAKFISRKREERDILTDIADKLTEATDQERLSFDRLAASETADLDQLELELLRRYGLQGGRYKLSDAGAHGRISLSTRGIKDSEINRCLTALSSTVTLANRRHRLGMLDPTFEMRLKTDGPNRNWLSPDHLELLLRVAREMDEVADRYDHNGREAGVLVFGLCGPRVHEFCAFNWTDLSEAGLIVRKSKTQAGERVIQVPDVAREALAVHRKRLGDPADDTPIWPTASGRRRDRNNVRVRLLAPVLTKARVELELSGIQEPLPARVTPHTFRRTAATYWYWLGRDERTTMHEIGHKNSRLTLEVYAQPRPRDERQKKMLKRWMKDVEL
jgi:integrase